PAASAGEERERSIAWFADFFPPAATEKPSSGCLNRAAAWPVMRRVERLWTGASTAHICLHVSCKDRFTMALPLQRYGFAAAVVGGIAVMAATVAGKSLLGGGEGVAAAKAPPAAGKMKGGGGPGGETPEVRATLVGRHVFSDAIQAIGT